MQSDKRGTPSVSGGKKAAFAVLFVTACAICLSGFFFGAYSILNGVSFQVINARIPGFVFALVVVYLGVRYLIMLFDLKKELFRPTSRFSWSNFRKKKQI